MIIQGRLLVLCRCTSGLDCWKRAAGSHTLVHHTNHFLTQCSFLLTKPHPTKQRLPPNSRLAVQLHYPNYYATVIGVWIWWWTKTEIRMLTMPKLPTWRASLLPVSRAFWTPCTLPIGPRPKKETMSFLLSLFPGAESMPSAVEDSPADAAVASRLPRQDVTWTGGNDCAHNQMMKTDLQKRER